jgi:hypothetical protein
MKASKQAKNMGLTNLKQVTEMTKAIPNTLRNWSIDKPELYRVVMIGCAAVNEENDLVDRYDAMMADE